MIIKSHLIENILSKKYYIFCLIFLALSCAQPGTSSETETDIDTKIVRVQKKTIPQFQTLLDSAKVNGTILILDEKENTFFSNDFSWADVGKLPASTYKIPHSMIALETKIVKDDSTLLKWDGEDRYLDIWEQDLIFQQAFQLSCLPCYQGIARKIGLEKMKDYLAKLEYGEMEVNSENIDHFWIQGNSRISPFEQIAFLQRFHHGKLPISQRTTNLMKEIMMIENNDYYILRGKTGWSISGEKDNGWFVGYLALKEQHKLVFFATNIEPKDGFNMDQFGVIRKDLTMKALSMLSFS